MDKIDQNIIRALQQNGRLSNIELAEQVNLSPSPCLRRVRQLQSSGVIKGYSAIVDPQQYGLPITVFISLKLEKHTKAVIKAFQQSIVHLPEVLACYLMAGKHDYLLHVISASMHSYELFVRDQLTQVPGIGEFESNFAFGQVKFTQVFPALVRDKS